MRSETCWFVSANIDRSGDQTQRFLEEGIWENNLCDEYGELVKSIQVGDRIAIKQTHNKKDALPFDFNDRLVSVMEIKATGIVIGNQHDGKTIKVKWKKEKKVKEWYFFTFIRVIWKVEPNDSNWMFKALIDFTFNNKPQDIKRFVKEPYWGNRLNNSDNISYQDEIVMVLRSLGGEATLTRIQEEIQNRNRLSEIKTDPDWQAGVRFTLQRFSSDSKSFAHGEDLFYTRSFYSGVWGLRQTEIKRNESYSKEDFLAEININASRYEIVTALLRERKSVMIKRVPGIGKNIFPECLSFSLMQVKDKNRVLSVQLANFFSSKEGLRRYYSADGRDFVLAETVFMNFCNKALDDTGNDYYFIIDDIDRENFSRILMDLMFLFRRNQHNSRGIDKNFTGELFCIPDNVFIMVILDTAGKSAAFVDNIFGRRYSIIEIEPPFDCNGAVNYLKSSAEIPDKQNEKPKMIRPRIKKETALEVMRSIKKIC